MCECEWKIYIEKIFCSNCHWKKNYLSNKIHIARAIARHSVDTFTLSIFFVTLPTQICYENVFFVYTCSIFCYIQSWYLFFQATYSVYNSAKNKKKLQEAKNSRWKRCRLLSKITDIKQIYEVLEYFLTFYKTKWSQFIQKYL